jgi:hypothetical protein
MYDDGPRLHLCFWGLGVFLMKRVLVGATGLVSLSAVPAFAAVDAAVTDAITAAGADVTTIGAAILGVAALAMAARWAKAMFF